MKGVRACTACVRERSGCKLYVRACRSHACVQGVRACKDCVQDVHEGVRASSPTTPHPQPLLLPNHYSSPATLPTQPLLFPNQPASPTTSPPVRTCEARVHASRACVHARRVCVQVMRASVRACKMCVRACVQGLRASPANTQQQIKLFATKEPCLEEALPHKRT